jgi:hypothetical protein
MGKFRLLAHPWWVNLLLLIPLALYFAWRNRGIQTPGRQLLFATIFAVAFGFVEAAVAIYLSAAAGLLPGYRGTLSEMQSLARATLPETLPIDQFPQSLLTVEVLREAATIVMLVGVALLAAGKARERCAVFLWSFAFWDISYYAGLWATIRWPTSLIDLDLLFLIPVPWVAQVWFPLLVSVLTLVAVILSRRKTDVSGFPELQKTLVVRSAISRRLSKASGRNPASNQPN